MVTHMSVYLRHSDFKGHEAMDERCDQARKEGDSSKAQPSPATQEA